MERGVGVQLQAGVTVSRDAEGQPHALLDSLLGRTVTLGSAARWLVAHVDGNRTLEQLCQAAAAAGPRDDAERALRSLMCLNVFAGCGDAIRERVARVKAAPDAGGWVSLPGARFECQGSGECCRNYHFGPLTPPDLTLLGTLPLPPELTFLDERPHATYLLGVDGHCVFLAGNQCSLHAAFGPTQKPAFCRLYPLEQLATMDGLKILDRGTCSSFAVSSARGELLLDQAARQADLFEGNRELYHPIVFLGPLPLDYGHFLRLGPLLQRLATAGSFPSMARLAAVGAALDALHCSLREMPLVLGAPDNTINDLLQQGEDRWLRGPWRSDGMDALRALLEELHAFSTGPLQGTTLPASRHLTAGPAAELGPTLRRLVERLPPHALTVPSPPTVEALQRSLQQHLFGTRALLQDRPVPALLKLAVVHLLAQVHALTPSGDQDLQRFSRGHALAMRVLDGANEIFLRQEVHAPAILGSLAHLETPATGH